jgi:hypothetical protein
METRIAECPGGAGLTEGLAMVFRLLRDCCICIRTCLEKGRVCIFSRQNVFFDSLHAVRLPRTCSLSTNVFPFVVPLREPVKSRPLPRSQGEVLAFG